MRRAATRPPPLTEARVDTRGRLRAPRRRRLAFQTDFDRETWREWAPGRPFAPGLADRDAQMRARRRSADDDDRCDRLQEATSANRRRYIGQPPSLSTPSRTASQPSPCRSSSRCSSSTRVRSGVSAMNRTSTSLVFSRSVSICHCGLISQLITTRSRRLVREHPRPAAHAAVDAAVKDVAADARFEDRLGDLDAQHVVLGRLERAEPVGEDRERTLDRRFDDDLVADRRR